MKNTIQLGIAGLGLVSALGVVAGNITIYDGRSSGTGWYGPQEDQETEQGTIANQSWDLEAFLLNGTKLTLVGGFDFKKGNSGFGSGDIFIDVNGDAVYGQDKFTTGGDGWKSDSNANYKYDYVIHFGRDVRAGSGLGVGTQNIGLNYSVVKLNDSSTVLTGYYRSNDGSNPYAWVRGGDAVTGAGGTASFGAYNNSGQGGTPTFAGGAHNFLEVDLGWLGDSLKNGTLFHFTLGCGNDNLMGRATGIPDAGATLALLGMGLLGVGALRRRSNA